MKLNFEDRDTLTVLTLQGDFTADNSDMFRKAVLEHMNRETRDFVLSLEQMEYIDSEGLESLLWLQGQCVERLGQIRLAAAQENVIKILEMTRLDSRLEKSATVEEAILSLS